MGYYYYDLTYILVIIGAVISFLASAKVKNTFKKYSKYMASCGMNAEEVASRILQENGCYDVKVRHTSGHLTDNFNPGSMTLNLSDSVYGSKSIAAIAVAAHESGHAIQRNEEYTPMKIRSLFVTPANFGSKMGIPAVILGLVLSFQPLISIGIILFSLGFLFQVITLPVEFDASKRALEILEGMGILQGDENSAAKKVLSAAALTYVAAAGASLLSLLRLILISRGRKD